MICENCGKKHDGEYGSGRFCCAKCARAFSTKYISEDGRERQKAALTNKENRDKARNSFMQNSKNYELDENGNWKKVPKQKKKKDNTNTRLGNKNNMRTLIKGKVGELETAKKFINHGYNVFVPLVDISGVDMIVEKDNGLKKIQVKSSNDHTEDNRVTTFHLSSNVYDKEGHTTRKKKYNKKDVDYFALYSEVDDDVYLVENPGNKSSINIRTSVSPTSLTSKGKNLEKMNMAEDYQIDKVLDDIDNGIIQSNTIVVDDYVEKDDE